MSHNPRLLSLSLILLQAHSEIRVLALVTVE